jgi:hypothetical protein
MYLTRLISLASFTCYCALSHTPHQVYCCCFSWLLLLPLVLLVLLLLSSMASNLIDSLVQSDVTVGVCNALYSRVRLTGSDCHSRSFSTIEQFLWWLPSELWPLRIGVSKPTNNVHVARHVSLPSAPIGNVVWRLFRLYVDAHQ